MAFLKYFLIVFISAVTKKVRGSFLSLIFCTIFVMNGTVTNENLDKIIPQQSKMDVSNTWDGKIFFIAQKDQGPPIQLSL